MEGYWSKQHQNAFSFHTSVEIYMTIFLLIIINEPILTNILFQPTFFSKVIFFKCEGMFLPRELVAKSATFWKASRKVATVTAVALDEKINKEELLN